MLFFLLLLSSSVVFGLAKTIELDKSPINLPSAPPRYIFLNDVGPTPKQKVCEFSVHPSLKIVNGQTAKRGQFCYQAYLQFTDGRNSWSCGGSLVTSSLVLTAAHCVQGAKSAIVVLGGLDLSRYDEPGRRVIRVYLSGLRFHEKYDSNMIHNDIGVVKLPEPMELNEYICTVKLPSCTTKLTADSDNKNNYTVSGWGKTSDRSYTAILMYVVMSGEPQNTCTSFYKTRARYDLIESQMCTSGAGGKSTCNGDSGGPLVQPDDLGNIIQQGIVSLGLKSCQLSAPSVYTDVRYFMDWLCPQL